MSTYAGSSGITLTAGSASGSRAVASYHIEGRSARLSSTETEAARREAREEVESSPRSREMLRVLNDWFDSAADVSEGRASGL